MDAANHEGSGLESSFITHIQKPGTLMYSNSSTPYEAARTIWKRYERPASAGNTPMTGTHPSGENRGCLAQAMYQSWMDHTLDTPWAANWYDQYIPNNPVINMTAFDLKQTHG